MMDRHYALSQEGMSAVVAFPQSGSHLTLLVMAMRTMPSEMRVQVQRRVAPRSLLLEDLTRQQRRQVWSS